MQIRLIDEYTIESAVVKEDDKGGRSFAGKCSFPALCYGMGKRMGGVGSFYLFSKRLVILAEGVYNNSVPFFILETL